MIINLKEDETLAAAVGGIKQWLLDAGGVTPGQLCDGVDPAWKAAYAILKEHGDGEYEIKEDGSLFKGGDLIVDGGDVKAFAFGEKNLGKPKSKKDEPTLDNIKPSEPKKKAKK